ncbi:MAG TPA: 30S ribosome-binding factor RbfA [Candidatus Binatia bacterium]|jgi:ribosome-binding factor A
MPGKRTERVGALLQEALSETLLRGVKDPRVGMVTVTGVDLSPDLKYARVFVSVVGDAEARARSLAGLASARAYLQAQAGKRLGLRYTPELRFEIDPSFDAADRVERLLREIHERDEKDAGTGADGADDADDADPDEPGRTRG